MAFIIVIILVENGDCQSFHHLDEDRSAFIDISPKKLEETGQESRTHVSSILKLQHPPKPDMPVCDYRLICPHKKFSMGVMN